jgi:hypothetical protein
MHCCEYSTQTPCAPSCPHLRPAPCQHWLSLLVCPVHFQPHLHTRRGNGMSVCQAALALRRSSDTCARTLMAGPIYSNRLLCKVTMTIAYYELGRRAHLTRLWVEPQHGTGCTAVLQQRRAKRHKRKPLAARNKGASQHVLI